LNNMVTTTSLNNFKQFRIFTSEPLTYPLPCVSIPRAQTRAEKPFVSEAGRRAFDELYRVHCDSVALLVGVPVQQRRRQVPTSELGRDVLHLLLGVPSATFPWDEVRDSVVCEGHWVLYLSIIIIIYHCIII
jgi:hypothetical protein